MKPIRPMAVPVILCECGAEYAIRRRNADQRPFLGCLRYPDCQHALDLFKPGPLLDARLVSAVERTGLDAAIGFVHPDNQDPRALVVDLNGSELVRYLIGLDPLDGVHDAQAAACLGHIVDAWLVLLEATRPNYFGRVLSVLHDAVRRRMMSRPGLIQPSDAESSGLTRKPGPRRGLIARLTKETQ